MQIAQCKKITSGTKEWADSNVNLINGCMHDCRYCYAKKMAIRFKRKTASTWKVMEIRWHDVNKRYSKRKGRVMFPTSHDLVPNEPFFTASMTVLKKLLIAGNDVLVTTKPHLPVIKYICEKFANFKEQIQFRFTITSLDDARLSFWEPGAPKFAERFTSLELAFQKGFKTSISIEPCLDPDPRPLVMKLEPFVTESIWLGSINYCGEHEFNSKETILKWMEWFNGNSLIRFKDSVTNKFLK
ncbi:MAG: radical SAM protein [Promethearchaeota archaeon]